MHTRQEKGFTLIELLIVIGIIGFLAAAVLVAVDPVKRIQDSRDAKRYSEANAILNAILTKQVDDRKLHNGCCDTGGAPIITQAGTNVQVIVTDDKDIVCNAEATRPGCDKPMDTTAANKACVALLKNQFDGTGTVASTGTTVTGTGTNFDPEVEVGDTLIDATNPVSVCVVATRTSDVDITCNVAPSPAMADDFYVVSADDSSIVPGYIGEFPVDPRGAGAAPCNNGSGCDVEGDLVLGAQNTGYYLARTAGNRIEIGSCAPEQATSISVKR